MRSCVSCTNTTNCWLVIIRSVISVEITEKYNKYIVLYIALYYIVLYIALYYIVLYITALYYIIYSTIIICITKHLTLLLSVPHYILPYYNINLYLSPVLLLSFYLYFNDILLSFYLHITLLS